MTNTVKPILVIPYNEDLIKKAAGFILAVRTSDTAEIGKIAAAVGASRLYCIEVSADSLASVDLKKEWLGLPLVFRLQSAGRLLDWVQALENLRNSAARFYFPITPENITAVRTLSSLMVKTGLILDESCSEWDALEDLLAYDAFGKLAHASAEPFRYVYSRYKEKGGDYNELYLDKEGSFIHCDENGNMALSRSALAKREFIGVLDGAGSADFGAISLAAREKGRAAFLKFEGCPVCPAWKVCGFRNAEEGKPCVRKQFMTALLEAAGEVNNNAVNNI